MIHRHLDKLFYAAALSVALASISCQAVADARAGHLQDQVAVIEAEASNEILPAVPAVLANPANPVAWYHIVGGLAVIVASLTGGPPAVRKIKDLLGRSDVAPPAPAPVEVPKSA